MLESCLQKKMREKWMKNKYKKNRKRKKNVFLKIMLQRFYHLLQK